MTKDPDHDVLNAHMNATAAAYQVLVVCLEENGALHRGQVSGALLTYMETMKSKPGAVNEMTLALLHGLRQGLIG